MVCYLILIKFVKYLFPSVVILLAKYDFFAVDWTTCFRALNEIQIDIFLQCVREKIIWEKVIIRKKIQTSELLTKYS